MDIDKIEMELKYKKSSEELKNKFQLDLNDKKIKYENEIKKQEMQLKEKENSMKLEYNINLINNLKNSKIDNSSLQLLQMILTNNSNLNQKGINSQAQSTHPQIYNPLMAFPQPIYNPQIMQNSFQPMYNPQNMYPQPIYNPQMMYPPQPMYNYQQQLLATPGNPNINNSQMNCNPNIAQRVDTQIDITPFKPLENWQNYSETNTNLLNNSEENSI